jgi:cytochrome c peroxidase
MYRLPRSALFICATALAACTGTETVFLAPEDVHSTRLDAVFSGLLAEAGVRALDVPSPESTAMVELGRMLFFDRVLSGNRNISCATCHHPSGSTGDGLPVSLGEGATGFGMQRQMGDGVMIPRNSTPLFNGLDPAMTVMFWDGRVSRDPASGALLTPEPGLNGPAPDFPEAGALNSALAAQAMFPVTSREEMRGQAGENEVADAADNAAVWAALTVRLMAIPEYQTLFSRAFPDVDVPEGVHFGHAARALAAFEGVAYAATETPLDRYLRGDMSALSQVEKEGGILFFGEAGCSVCHSGPLLSDLEFHALAVPQVGPGKLEDQNDRGRALLTKDGRDDFKFRTPPLRNVELTGPWTHAGAFTALHSALEHALDPIASFDAYEGGELPPLFRATVDTDAARNAARRAALDPLIRASRLSSEEFVALIEFLHALTDPRSRDLLGEIPGRVPSGLPVGEGG